MKHLDMCSYALNSCFAFRRRTTENVVTSGGFVLCSLNILVLHHTVWFTHRGLIGNDCNLVIY